VTLVEHYSHALADMMALHTANARVTATRLLDRQQPHITEVLIPMISLHLGGELPTCQ